MVRDSLPSGSPTPRLTAILGATAAGRAARAALAVSALGLGGLWAVNRLPPTAPAAPAERAADGIERLEPEALGRLRSALLAPPPDAAPTPLAQPAAEGTAEPPATPFAAPEPDAPTAPAPVAESPPTRAESPPALAVQTVPLPVPRPPEFRRAPDTRRAERPARRPRVAAVPPAQEDTRNFFEKLFGLPSTQTPALSYAALEKPAIAPPAQTRPLTPIPVPQAGGGTATYDISARTVTLPSGETLEAHSGLGPLMDDPRHVHMPMRGATPPGTYDLTEREALFHGVRAIRLTPVGGPGAIHGRVGLLAHTFMLGPTGQSNGCVAFRNYDRFLQAYLRGEITRLVVVPGRGDWLPSVAGGGGSVRTASAADGR